MRNPQHLLQICIVFFSLACIASFADRYHSVQPVRNQDSRAEGPVQDDLNAAGLFPGSTSSTELVTANRQTQFKGGYGVMNFEVPGVTRYAIGVREDNLSLALGSSADQMDIANDSRLLILSQDGRVGIGTADPSEQLEVVGNIRFGDVVLRSSYGSPEGKVAGSVGDLYLRRDGGPGATFYVKEAGYNTPSGWVAK